MTLPIIILIALVAAIPLSWIGRMMGGAPPKLPWGLDAWLYAIPFGILGFLMGGWLGLLSGYLTAFLSGRLGHGQYLSPIAKLSLKPRKPEKIDFLVKLFFGTDPTTTKEFAETHSDRMVMLEDYGIRKFYWRAIFGMSLTGFVSVIGLLPFSQDWVQALLLFVVGFVAKGLAYMIGWAIYPNYIKEDTSGGDSEWNEATEIGEYLRALFPYTLVLAYILYYLVN